MLPRTFHILTFGCQMNARDSQWLAACLKSRGFLLEALENAQVIILNTCSVRQKPELKVASALGRINQLTHNNPHILVCVLGCVAQQMGISLYQLNPQVRLISGGDNIHLVPDAIEKLLHDPKECLDYLAFSPLYVEREQVKEDNISGSAFVNIMQGCDNFCSYCIVPFTKGRQKSRTQKCIVEECRGFLRNGCSSITLLGQNVNAYGKDCNEPAFPQLLKTISQLEGVEFLRFVTPHPKDMDMETVRAFADLPNLCPQLHLPLQAGSDKILKAMRRRYDSSQYLQLIDNLRAACPDIALSTDLIVGFPGETEQDFQDTLSLMQKCGFVSSFSFCYSDRPFTKASTLPDKIPDTVKHERLLRLQEVQEKMETSWLSSRVGQKVKVIVESPSSKNSENFWQCRDPYGAVVNVSILEKDNQVGKILNVLITQAKRHSLMGEIVS